MEQANAQGDFGTLDSLAAAQRGDAQSLDLTIQGRNGASGPGYYRLENPHPVGNKRFTSLPHVNA